MKNLKRLLAEKTGRIKAGGLGIGLVFLTIAAVFSAVVLTSPIEATEIKPAANADMYYATNPSNISLPLNTPNTSGDAFVVFTKADTTYSLYSYTSLVPEDAAAVIATETPWKLGTENVYYVGFTTQSKDTVKTVNSFNQTEQTNPTAILFERDGVSITLKPIKVVFDNVSPVISFVSITEKKTLKSDEKISITFKIADAETNVSVDSIAVRMNRESPVSVTPGTDNTYTAVFDASAFTTDLENGDMFPVMDITIDAKDIAGNAATQYSEENRDCELKFDNLQITDIHIESNNSKNNLAKTGNEITLNFKTNISIADSDIKAVTIGGRAATVSQDGLSYGKNWKATCTLESGDIAIDNSALLISIAITSSGITKSATATTDSSVVTFYDEIAADGLKFESNFAGNPTYAVDGNILFVTFTTTHPVIIDQSKIEGHNVTFTSENNNTKWKASYEVSNTPNNGEKYTFSFRVNDAAGNEKVYSQTSLTSGIIYADVLISLFSNNSDTSYATHGNTITLTVTSATAITSIDNANIAGIQVNNFSAVNDKSLQWTATADLTASTTLTDNAVVPFSFSVTSAGRTTVKTQDVATSCVGVTDQVVYYAPLYLSNVAIQSTNTNTAFAKTGDTITVSFKAQHAINVSAGVIEGEPVSFTNTNGDKMTWKASHTFKDSDVTDIQSVSFSLSVKDAAGNTAAPTESDSANKVEYYAPLQISALVYKSSNTNMTIAKNDDKVTVSFKTQHEINVPVGKIAGISAPFTNKSGDKMTWEASYTLEDKAVSDRSFIQAEFTVTDDAGNTVTKPQDDPAFANQIEYYAPLQVSDLLIQSSNADTTAAKIGDMVTVSFRTQHEISVPVGNIAGIPSVFTNISGDNMTWQASYPIAAGVVSDTKNVTFSLTAADTAGNTISKEDTDLDDSNQVRYLDLLNLTDAQIVSNNDNPKLAMDGNKVTVSFKTQHKIYTPVGEIAGRPVDFTNTNGDKMTWQASCTLAAGNVTDQTIVPFNYEVKDAAGNSMTQTQTGFAYSVIYEAALSISDLDFKSDNAVTTLAMAEDIVTVSFKTQHAIAAPVGFIASKSLTFTNAAGDQMTWQASYLLKQGDVPDNGTVPFSLTAADSAGNTISKTHNDLADVNQVTYYAPIISQNIAFTSDNEIAGQGYAKDADVITLLFHTTHPVIISSAYIAGQPASIISVNNNKMDWVASYTVENGKIPDNTDITFTGVLTDPAGNAPMTISQNGTQKVRYQAPIAEGLSAVVFVSNNAKTGEKYAKNGDTATLSFSTTHPVTLSSTQINGITDVIFSSTNNDNMHWTAAYTIPENTIDDNNDIPFSFVLSDVSANTVVTQTQSDAGKIRYQAPISITNLSLVSDNEATAEVVRNGSKITLTFQTLHPVSLTTVKIAGQAVSCSSADNDGMTWSAVYTTQNGTTADNAAISLNLFIDDLAGNAPAAATENDTKTGKIKYYAPIVISDAAISTTNSNDASSYAKDADTVYVTFVTNHDTAISDVSIAGQSPALTKTDSAGISKSWTLTYSIKNGDVPDLAAIPFAFTAKDIAGNDPVKKTGLDEDVSHSIQYFAPITATTSISSNGSNAAFAQNEDSITVSAATNHAARVVAASILTRGTNNSGDNSMQLAVSYTVPSFESALPEGTVPFLYTITDAAGNTLDVSETNSVPASTVTYDRTKPTVEITPDFSGFTNQTVAFKITFSDVNLDRQRVSIKINGEEQISSADRSSITGTVYTKKITVETDNTYKLDAGVTDMAGNQAESNVRTTVTIDKTNPEVSAVKIDLLTPKTYKAGFVLGEYLDITEKNVDQIICTVTDSEGVHDWDINTPITTNGKNTAYLLVTDMAGNHSTALTYDLYIDGLVPKAMVRDTVTGAELAAGTDNVVFISKMTLDISLEALNIGDEAADHFAILKLVDKNGALVVDLLNTMTASGDGMYTLPLDAFGEYTLLAEAQDAVGNATGTLAYHFTFRDKSILQKYYENKPLFYSSIPVLGVLAAGGIFLLTANKRRKRISPAQNHL